jgi:hypothetical protein
MHVSHALTLKIELGPLYTAFIFLLSNKVGSHWDQEMNWLGEWDTLLLLNIAPIDFVIGLGYWNPALDQNLTTTTTSSH